MAAPALLDRRYADAMTALRLLALALLLTSCDDPLDDGVGIEDDCENGIDDDGDHDIDCDDSDCENENVCT